MNFLTPLFLTGLAALAIPVFIHLINREKKVVVLFPSLMFLHKIPYKSVRRQKIRHLLLLIMEALTHQWANDAPRAATARQKVFSHPLYRGGLARGPGSAPPGSGA